MDRHRGPRRRAGVRVELRVWNATGPVATTGRVTSIGLTALALLHTIWLVAPWPMSTWEAWGSALFTEPELRATPSVIVTLVSAVGAYVVAARAGLVRQIGPSGVYHIGTWLLAAVLLARGVEGMTEARLLAEADHATLNISPDNFSFYLLLYLPSFLLLGVLSLVVAASGPAKPPPRNTPGGRRAGGHRRLRGRTR
ncbi:MAG: DUF3995 domain-containing protein [Chloroflexi bacterium]|nr:DUF3995 domain-containing protein [Chloroflexota bacterium]